MGARLRHSQERSKRAGGGSAAAAEPGRAGRRWAAGAHGTSQRPARLDVCMAPIVSCVAGGRAVSPSQPLALSLSDTQNSCNREHNLQAYVQDLGQGWECLRIHAAQNRGSPQQTPRRATARAAGKSMREHAEGLWAQFKSPCIQSNTRQQQEGLARERVAEQSVALKAMAPHSFARSLMGREVDARHRCDTDGAAPGAANPCPAPAATRPPTRAP